jgi:hypothetical protein
VSELVDVLDAKQDRGNFQSAGRRKKKKSGTTRKRLGLGIYGVYQPAGLGRSWRVLLYARFYVPISGISDRYLHLLELPFGGCEGLIRQKPAIWRVRRGIGESDRQSYVVWLAGGAGCGWVLQGVAVQSQPLH